MVLEIPVGVVSFFVPVGPGGHETVDGGDEQSLEDENAQKINQAVLEIIASALELGRLFDDGDLIVVAGIPGGVKLVPEPVGSLFKQHPGTDEIDKGVPQTVTGKDTQGEIHRDKEKEKRQGDLFSRIMGENPVDEQQRILQPETLQEHQRQGSAKGDPFPVMLRNPEEGERDDG
jgi:hypothetical protein